MVTIKIEFDYNGKKHNLKAILNNDLSKLSSSKNNNATEIIDDFGNDNRWLIVFDQYDDGYLVEVVMYRDEESGEKTTDADYAIIWKDDVIDEEVDVKSSVKRT